MPKNAVIIIPNISNEEQVCDFLWQTKNLLAKNNEVFVIDYFKPFKLLPFSRFKIIDQFNKAIYFFFLQLYFSIKFHKPGRKYYFWMFFPQLVMAIKFKLPWWQVVFDIVDYHDSPIAAERKLLQKQKKYLLGKANHVFSISHALKRLYQKDTKVEIELVPQGFDLKSFGLDEKKSTLKFPIGKPVIGFVGQISQRLDLELLLELVANNKQWNFVFVGPKHHESNIASSFHKADETEIKRLFAYENVFYFGKQARQEMLNIIKQFDVCLIPYDVGYDFNRYCYPMKIFEYFYVGKPVVSTEIEELKNFNDLVKIAKTAKEFTGAIADFLKKPWSDEMRQKQTELARNNTWEEKISKIGEYLLD